MLVLAFDARLVPRSSYLISHSQIPTGLEIDERKDFSSHISSERLFVHFLQVSHRSSGLSIRKIFSQQLILTSRFVNTIWLYDLSVTEKVSFCIFTLLRKNSDTDGQVRCLSDLND